MQEMLLSSFEWLKNLNPIVYIVVIAFVPLIELRGSIPIAIALNFAPLHALWWSLIGSMIPAFLVIPLFAGALQLMKQHHCCPWLTAWLERKFASKANQVAGNQAAIDNSNKKSWQKELLKFWSIVIFVGIPLPGTGVWTGAAIASMIKMPFTKALGAVFMGDLLAGIIMLAISLGVAGIFT